MQFDNVTVTRNPDWVELDVQITEFNGHSTLDFYLNVLKTINHPKVIDIVTIYILWGLKANDENFSIRTCDRICFFFFQNFSFNFFIPKNFAFEKKNFFALIEAIIQIVLIPFQSIDSRLLAIEFNIWLRYRYICGRHRGIGGNIQSNHEFVSTVGNEKDGAFGKGGFLGNIKEWHVVYIVSNSKWPLLSATFSYRWREFAIIFAGNRFFGWNSFIQWTKIGTLNQFLDRDFKRSHR